MVLDRSDMLPTSAKGGSIMSRSTGFIEVNFKSLFLH